MLSVHDSNCYTCSLWQRKVMLSWQTITWSVPAWLADPPSMHVRCGSCIADTEGGWVLSRGDEHPPCLRVGVVGGWVVGGPSHICCPPETAPVLVLVHGLCPLPPVTSIDLCWLWHHQSQCTGCTTEKGTNGKWSSWGSLMWTHCTVPLVCLVSLVCHSLSLQCLPLPHPHHQYHPQSSLKSPTMLFYHRLPTIGPSLSIIPMQHKLTWSWLGSEETRHTTTSILI